MGIHEKDTQIRQLIDIVNEKQREIDSLRKQVKELEHIVNDKEKL